MLTMLERLQQAPSGGTRQQGTDHCYHILSWALHLKSFATVARKFKVRVRGQTPMCEGRSREQTQELVGQGCLSVLCHNTLFFFF